MPQNSDLADIVRQKWPFSDDDRLRADAHLRRMRVPVEPDLAFLRDGTLSLVVAAARPSMDSLARLVLARELADDKRTRIRAILAGKSFPPAVADAAKAAGVELLQVHHLAAMPAARPPRGVDYSSDKSWRVVARLLAEGPSSIRHLAISEAVSYGWANRVINGLVGQNAVERAGRRFRVSNADAIINAVGWERPLDRLRVSSIEIDVADAAELAAALKPVRYAFAGATAANVYTAYAIGYDFIQIYVEDDALALIRSMEKESTTTVHLYRPDRDIIGAARTVGGLRVASPAQALLDLAGMGYAYRDAARAMVERYASL